MHFKKNISLFLAFFFISTFYAEAITITIDISKLETGDTPRNFIYLSTITSSPVGNENTVKLNVDHLPTLLYLNVRKKNRFYLQKLIWVDATNVTLQGNLQDISTLKVLPESEEQQTANLLFPSISKEKEPNNKLATTRAYLVHLTYKKNFKKPEYLSSVLAELPEYLNDFWATKELRSYVKSLQNVGYNDKEGIISSVTAIDKNGEEITYQKENDKYLLLDFSASWCAPCLNDIDKLVALHAKSAAQLNIVMLWKDKSFDYWKSAAKEKKDKITWNSFFDKDGLNAEAFNVNVYPTYMLFNKQGKRVKTWKGNLPSNLDKFLK